MLTNHDNYYLKQEEPYKSCLMALKDIILGFDENITPEWKYGLPFSITRKKCFVISGKIKTQEPYIGVCRGSEIEHPLLEAENRKKIKIFRVNPNKDIDIKSLEEILSKAIKLYQA